MRNIEQLQQDIKELEETLSIKKQQLEEKAKDKIFCSGCGYYMNPSDVMKGDFTTTEKNVCVYSDAGYGDDDEYADVTYLVMVERCPRCGYKIKDKKIYISESNRRCRTQYKKSV